MTNSGPILLISNSTCHRKGYLEHVAADIAEVTGGSRRVAFVPFAANDLGAYVAQARQRFAEFGCTLASVHDTSNPRRLVEQSDAIFAGGGNTFRLLTALYHFGLLEPIRERVRAGGSYIGSSAGSIVAGPSLRTTKDMPIVQPPSFDALGIVDFHISPHFLDPDPSSTHMGETQEERILQFLEENDGAVVGLREGSWLRCQSRAVILKGAPGARLFRRDMPLVEVRDGQDITSLVSEAVEVHA